MTTMKKRPSHFAYNERSRSGWTLSIPLPNTSDPNPLHHNENCYLCPRYVCYPCPRSVQKGDKGGFEFDFSCRHRLDLLNGLLMLHPRITFHLSQSKKVFQHCVSRGGRGTNRSSRSKPSNRFGGSQRSLRRAHLRKPSCPLRPPSKIPCVDEL